MVKGLDARAQKSQKALLKAGLELLNRNQEATLSDIAAHAGVGRTTLYRQYETREKLIAAIALDCLESIDQATASIERQAKSALDAIRLLFEYAMPLTQEFQFLINLEHLLIHEPKVIKVYENQRKEISELVEYGMKKGEINSKLPVSWVVNLIDGLFYIAWLQQQRENTSPEQAAQLAFISFSQGIRAN